MARVGMFGRFDSGRGRARMQQKQSATNSEGHMKLDHDNYPSLPSPIVVSYQDFWATWHGGEYINVYAQEEGARRCAARKHPGEYYAIAPINTTGDEVDVDDLESYVLSELTTWVNEDS